jgi:hypothetical protein
VNGGTIAEGVRIVDVIDAVSMDTSGIVGRVEVDIDFVSSLKADRLPL